MQTKSFPQPAELETILAEVGSYYSQKLAENGPTAAGVDWSSDDAQLSRLEIMLQILENEVSEGNTLLDYGCGYGRLCSLVNSRFPQLKYSGYDISSDMLELARQSGEGDWSSNLPEDSFDFVIASGTFNVRLTFSEPSWRTYVEYEGTGEIESDHP